MTYIFLSRHTLFQNVVHSSILSSLCIAPIYILISFSFSPLFSSLFPFSLLTYTPQTYYISHLFMISYPSLHLSFLPHLSLSLSLVQFFNLSHIFFIYINLSFSLLILPICSFHPLSLSLSRHLSLYPSPILLLSLSFLTPSLRLPLNSFVVFTPHCLASSHLYQRIRGNAKKSSATEKNRKTSLANVI